METKQKEEAQSIVWTPIMNGDAVTVLNAVFTAEDALAEAQKGLEMALLATPAVWSDKRKDSVIAKEIGKSSATVASYRRLGRILATCAPSDGIAPTEVRALVNKATNEPGSAGENIDKVLDKYLEDEDTPTVAGAMKAIRAKIKKEATPDAIKFDDRLDWMAKFLDKGYVPTDEQVARGRAIWARFA